MNNLWFLISLICFFPMFVSGQTEYILMDSVITSGIKLIDGGDKVNSRTCQVQNGNDIITYSPYQVNEYGFKDGRVYVSRKIQVSDSLQNVFLERLHDGNTDLYYYRGDDGKTFFLEKDSTLFTEIPRRNKDGLSFHKQLLNITHDCSNVAEASKVVSYNKKPLAKLVSRYNACELKPFPHLKVGINFGFEWTKLNPVTGNVSENLHLFDFKYEGSYSFGLFLDNPIRLSNFSFHPEINYSRHGYSYSRTIENKDFDFLSNITSLSFPLMIRYSYPSNNFRPYVNAGLIYSRNIINDNLLFIATKTDDIITINHESEYYLHEYVLIDKNQGGLTIGGGLECNLNYNHSLFFEVRYCNLRSPKNEVYLSDSLINLFIGINI